MEQGDKSVKGEYVCQTAAVPSGEMRCFEVSGRRVLIANTEMGWFASDEMCTHEDASLCVGNLTGCLVKCPLHGSRFDLRTGAVLDDPADEDLRIHSVAIDQGQVFINLPAEPDVQ